MPDAPDYAAATVAARRTWADGDFSRVASMLNGVAEDLAEALQLLPDDRVLDVATGSGNGVLAAARRTWVGAVGTDFVPALLQRGRERAAAERLDVEFVEADAQELPFEDASFDVVISIFGAMFAPNQERTARELLRVTKPGGRIGMCNWTPDGRLADFFAMIGRHVGAPAPGAVLPVHWGGEDHVRGLFGEGIADLKAERCVNRQAFRSPDHYIEFFRTYFGPMRAAFDKVGPEGAPALEADIRDYLAKIEDGGPALVLEPEYLQVVAIRA